MARALAFILNILFNGLEAYLFYHFFPVFHFHKYIGTEIPGIGLQGTDTDNARPGNRPCVSGQILLPRYCQKNPLRSTGPVPYCNCHFCQAGSDRHCHQNIWKAH